MTPDDDFIGQLEGYLDEYEGITPLSAAVRNAIRAELPRTRQIGRLAGPMRYLKIMSKPVLFAIGAAAVLVLAVVGYQLLSGRGVGGPEATVSPIPTPSPSSPPVQTLPVSGPLAPGRYAFLIPNTYVTGEMNVGEGWESEGWSITSGDVATLSFTNLADVLPERQLLVDPCPSAAPAPPPDQVIGSTAADLVAAIEARADPTISAAIDVTVGGFAGARFEITDSRCSGSYLFPRPHTVWILDVNGARVIFQATYDAFFAHTSRDEQAVADARAIIAELIDSVTFRVPR